MRTGKSRLIQLMVYANHYVPTLRPHLKSPLHIHPTHKPFMCLNLIVPGFCSVPSSTLSTAVHVTGTKSRHADIRTHLQFPSRRNTFTYL